MSFFGKEGESVPPQFGGLFEYIPEDEEVIYWLRGDDSSFCDYYKYINSETCWSCPPFSWVFPLFNLFNMPCIYADFRNNSSKILMMTKQTVILGTVDTPYSCCCFQPDTASENADVFSWRNVKYVGSKQEFHGMNKDTSSTFNCLASAFFNEPKDILMVAKKKNDRAPRGLWIDYVPYRSMRLDELRQLRQEVLASGYVRPKGIRLVELGNVSPKNMPVEDESDDDSCTNDRLRPSVSPSGIPPLEIATVTGVDTVEGSGASHPGTVEGGSNGFVKGDSVDVDDLGDVYAGVKGEGDEDESAGVRSIDDHPEPASDEEVQQLQDIYAASNEEDDGEN